MDRTRNGLNSEWAELRVDSTPNGLNPDGVSILNGVNSEWNSTSNFYQPRMVQLQGADQNNEFKKRIQEYILVKGYQLKLLHLRLSPVWC
jgi:hypothetical protein